MKRKEGMKKIAIIFILAFILIFVILVSYEVLQRQEAKECSKDADCIKVQKTCCACSMGGEEVCIAKSMAEEVKAKNCPSDLMCIALYNCKIKSCSCVQGKCEAVPLE